MGFFDRSTPPLSSFVTWTDLNLLCIGSFAISKLMFCLVLIKVEILGLGSPLIFDTISIDPTFDPNLTYIWNRRKYLLQYLISNVKFEKV